MSKIQEALQSLFKDNRIVFWYDEKQELTDEFNTISNKEINKIHVEGNEFNVRYIVEKEKPNDNFLLYFTSSRPIDSEHWLLDLELAHTIFYTNQEALHLQDLGLPYSFNDLVKEHIEFFKAETRKKKLKEFINFNDSSKELLFKMLAVTFGTDHLTLLSYIQLYAKDFVDNGNKIEAKLKKFNLYEVFWSEVEKTYGYNVEEKQIYDFLVTLFATNTPLIEQKSLSKESKLIVSQWQDLLSYQKSYKNIEEQLSEALSIESKLNNAHFDNVMEDTLFRLTDKRIIHDLLQQVAEEEISLDRLKKYLKKRENSFWYPTYKTFYDCLLKGRELIELVRKNAEDINFISFEDGIHKYIANYYQVDATYRNFVESYRLINQDKIFSSLAAKIEKVYANDWLLIMNDKWQNQIIDKQEVWPFIGKNAQKGFYNNYIRPITERKRKSKIFVIISDALRYECGVELYKTLQSENRFESEIDHLITSLPSYTQLGMASLLPHQSMRLDDGEMVSVDGVQSNGIAGRTKILQKELGERGTAILAQDLMAMNSSTEGREFAKKYDVVYVYHNHIDKTGDDKTSEEKVFDAVKSEIEFLKELLKKISNLNVSNMFVTADHGFIYQHNKLEDSDFAKAKIEGDIWKENRRFVLGKELSSTNNLTHFTTENLGLEKGGTVLIPKSINRLRVKGAGAQFVHGGASLQEIVVPFIKVTKTRGNTTKQVDIDILKGTTQITTGIHVVSFIQSEAVTDSILPRQIRAFIQAKDGQKLSEVFNYNFDSSEATFQAREVKHTFQLSALASSKYKNQDVDLILETAIVGTSNWDDYTSFPFTLKISFTGDFDF